jgi:hypothetical protein
LVKVLTTVTGRLAPLQASVAVGGSKVQELPTGTDLLGAQLMMGGVVAATVTVCAQMLLLPQQSVASQVRVIIWEQGVPFVTVLKMMPWKQQLSDATGVPKSQAVPHGTVKLVGQKVKNGGVVSTTFTS